MPKNRKERLSRNPIGRSEDTPDSAQMREVARMYYVEGRTRQEISQELGLDARKVSWLIEQAKDLGIVRITILGPPQDELAAKIKRKFPHLDRVLIAPGGEIKTPRQIDELFERFAVLASDYFETLLSRHPRGKPYHLGVTGGNRLLQFANEIPVRPRENLYVHAVALIGRGHLATSSHIEPSIVASVIAMRSGNYEGHAVYETVEPYRIAGGDGRAVVQKELNRLQKITSIERVIRDMDTLDAVFAGFGFPTISALEGRLGMGKLLESVVTSEQLADEGIVGDYCYIPYDPDGHSSDRWRFFLTAGHYSEYPGIEFYKHMVATGKKCIGFGGPGLLPAIKAALKARIVNVIIIDQHCAEALAKGD